MTYPGSDLTTACTGRAAPADEASRSANEIIMLFIKSMADVLTPFAVIILDTCVVSF